MRIDDTGVPDADDEVEGEHDDDVLPFLDSDAHAVVRHGRVHFWDLDNKPICLAEWARLFELPSRFVATTWVGMARVVTAWSGDNDGVPLPEGMVPLENWGVLVSRPDQDSAEFRRATRQAASGEHRRQVEILQAEQAVEAARQPGVEQPGVGQPGVGQPGVGQLIEDSSLGTRGARSLRGHTGAELAEMVRRRARELAEDPDGHRDQ